MELREDLVSDQEMIKEKWFLEMWAFLFFTIKVKNACIV